MELSHAEDRLNKLLRKQGFDHHRPDPVLALKAFKKFAEETVECDGDLLICQCGTANITGNNLYKILFARQFIAAKEGGWNIIMQLFIELSCQSNETLSRLTSFFMADEFESVELFFRKIENSKSYKTALAESAWDCKVRRKAMSLFAGRKYLCAT